jgi:hypothetical protein
LQVGQALLCFILTNASGSLTSLDLSNALLPATSSLPALTVLHRAHILQRVTLDGLDLDPYALSPLTSLTSLSYLSLRSTLGLTDVSMRHIGFFSRLQELAISGVNHITDEGFVSVLGARKLRKFSFESDGSFTGKRLRDELDRLSGSAGGDAVNPFPRLISRRDVFRGDKCLLLISVAALVSFQLYALEFPLASNARASRMCVCIPLLSCPGVTLRIIALSVASPRGRSRSIESRKVIECLKIVTSLDGIMACS